MLNKTKIAVASAFATVGTAANAAVDLSALTAGVTEAGTDAASIAGVVLGGVVAIGVAFIGVKLVRRGISKIG